MKDVDSSDDEFHLAKMMCLHLNKIQKEQDFYTIQNVVGKSIDIILKGMAVHGAFLQFCPRKYYATPLKYKQAPLKLINVLEIRCHSMGQVMNA